MSSLEDTIDGLLKDWKIHKALDFMSQLLKMKSSYFGEDSSEVTSYISYILTTISSASLKLIENDKIRSSISILRSCLMIINTFPLSTQQNRLLSKEISQTLHTFSCSLRKSGELSLSEKYALKSLTFCRSKSSERLLSSIYLNLCNIYSLQSDHKKAIKFCTLAVQLAEADYFNSKRLKPVEQQSQEISVLAVAYHNLAVEEEYMKNYEVSLSWYYKALRFLEKHANFNNSDMLNEFRNSFEAASKKCRQKVYPRLDKSLKASWSEDSFVADLYLIKNLTKNRTQGNFFKAEDKAEGRRAESSNSVWSKKSKDLKDFREINDFKGFKARDLRLQDSETSLKLYEASASSKRSQSSASRKKLKLFERNRIFLDFHETIKEDKSSFVKRHKNRRESFKKTEELINVVIKLQSFWRQVRVRNWFNQVRSGAFRERLAKCEKISLGKKEMVKVQVRNKGFLLVFSFDDGMERKVGLFEVCQVLGCWTGDEFEKQFFRLLAMVEKGLKGLKLNRECSFKLISKFIKESFLGGYQILVYSVNSNKGQHYLFYGIPLNYSKEMTRFLMINIKDLTYDLGLKPSELNEETLHIEKRVKVSSEKGEIGIVLEKPQKIPDKFNETEKFFEKFEKVKKKPSKKSPTLTQAALIIQKNFRMLREMKKFHLIQESLKKFSNGCPINEFLYKVKVIQKFFRLRRENKKFRLQKEKAKKFQRILVRLQRRFLRMIVEFKGKRGSEARAKAVMAGEKEGTKKSNSVMNADNRLEGMPNPIVKHEIQSKSKPQHQAKKSKSMSIVQAITIIQKAIRGYLARKHNQKPFQPTKAKKVHFQSKAQSVQTSKPNPQVPSPTPSKPSKPSKPSNPINPSPSSILTVQKHIRGFQARKAFKVYKTFCTLSPLRFPYLIHSIIKIQLKAKPVKPAMSTMSTKLKLNSSLKQLNLIKDPKSKKIILHLFHCIIQIQSWFKGQQLRNSLKSLQNPIKIPNPSYPSQLLDSTLKIQKHIRGHLARKRFKFLKKLNEKERKATVKAVLLVQKIFRGWKARKEFLDSKNGHLVQERNALLFDDVPYLISISKTSKEYVVKALDLHKFTSIFHKVELSVPIPLIIENLAISNNCMKLDPAHKNQPFKYLVHQDKKVIDWEHYLISIYLEPECYCVSATGSSKPMFLRLNFSELVERYSECIDVSDIMNDLIVDPKNNRMMISSKVILLKKSKYFQDKLYTVNMYQKDSFLIFEIMFDSSYKKRIPIEYDLALRETGITNGLIVLGTFIIDNCILIHGKKINICFKQKKLCDQTNAIIKVQARIRAFLTRKRLSGRNLVLVCDRVMNSCEYTLYCHYYAGRYEIIARCPKASLVLIIDKKLNHEQMLNHLRKIILPNLQITRANPEKLIMRVSITNPEKFVYKPRSSSSLGFSQIIMNKDQISLAKLTKALNINRNQSLEKPKIQLIRKEKTSNFDEILQPCVLSPPLTPLASTKKPETSKPEIIKSQELEKIVFKSSLNLSGMLIIVSMQVQGKGIYVQALNESGTLDLELFVKAKNVESMNKVEIEKLCSQILVRLKIVSSVDQKLKLTIEDSREDSRDQVIYRRRHIISNRYMTVSVFENSRGVFLVATEGDKGTFNLTLGKFRVGNSQNIQEELNSLIKRLKIQNFAGQEILVVSS